MDEEPNPRVLGITVRGRLRNRTQQRLTISRRQTRLDSLSRQLEVRTRMRRIPFASRPAVPMETGWHTRFWQACSLGHSVERTLGRSLALALGSSVDSRTPSLLPPVVANSSVDS